MGQVARGVSPTKIRAIRFVCRRFTAPIPPGPSRWPATRHKPTTVAPACRRLDAPARFTRAVLGPVSTGLRPHGRWSWDAQPQAPSGRVQPSSLHSAQPSNRQPAAVNYASGRPTRKQFVHLQPVCIGRCGGLPWFRHCIARVGSLSGVGLLRRRLTGRSGTKLLGIPSQPSSLHGKNSVRLRQPRRGASEGLVVMQVGVHPRRCAPHSHRAGGARRPVRCRLGQTRV